MALENMKFEALQKEMDPFILPADTFCWSEFFRQQWTLKQRPSQRKKKQSLNIHVFCIFSAL